MDSKDNSKILDKEIKKNTISTIASSYSTQKKLHIFANIIVNKLIQKASIAQEENYCEQS